jgi:hypothetical protein
MADAATRPMTTDRFLGWHKHQATLFELADGVPVDYRGTETISGGGSPHDRIVTNIIIALGNQPGDGPRRPPAPSASTGGASDMSPPGAGA